MLHFYERCGPEALVKPRKTRPDMTEKNVDCDLKNQTK